MKASPSQQALIKEKKRQDRLMARQAKKDELKRKADEDRAKKKEACYYIGLSLSLSLILDLRLTCSLDLEKNLCSKHSYSLP